MAMGCDVTRSPLKEVMACYYAHPEGVVSKDLAWMLPELTADERRSATQRLRANGYLVKVGSKNLPGGGVGVIYRANRRWRNTT